MKHIVVLSALIMTSTLVHAGVMPEDLLPSVEATKAVIDQAITTEPTFQEKLDGFLQFVMMSLLVLI